MDRLSGGVGSVKSSEPTFLGSLDYKPAQEVLLYAKVSTSFQAGE